MVPATITWSAKTSGVLQSWLASHALDFQNLAEFFSLGWFDQPAPPSISSASTAAIQDDFDSVHLKPSA
jgi:hypothetical protein